MAKSEFKIAYALKCLSDEFVEYHPIIDKIRLVKDDREKTTMWVNPHLEMGYSERFCDKLNPAQLKAVVLHEIRHVEYGHFTREASIRRVYGNFHSHSLHNVAMDLEINSKISNLPEDGCFPKNFGYPENLTYEEYFQKLIKDPNIEKKIIYIMGGSGDGSGSGMQLPNDVDIDHINECPGVRNKSSSGQHLSIEDEGFLSDLQKEIEENNKSRGSGKGNATGQLKIKPTKPLDILNYIRTRCSNVRNEKTFGYDRINYDSFKSSTIPDLVEFKTYNEIVPVTLSFIIDVSGSRTDAQINDSISKIWSTLESVDDISFIIDIYFADDGVTQVNRVLSKADIPKTFKGRGGTYLSKAYAEFKIEYDLVVIMTDGYIDWADVNALEKKFYDRTVIGIDKESYLITHTQTSLPTFVL